MRKLLVLKLDGDIIEGIRATLNVEEHGNHPHIEITGYLPANQELAAALKRWQSNYRSWGRSYRIKAIVTERQWRQDCYSSAKELHQQLNRWLLSDSFRPIREQCLQQFVSPHEVQVLIRTSSQLLLKLPWYLWDLVDKNSLLEVVFGKPDCEPRIRAKTPTLRGKVKILAILGNSIGIDVQKDRQALEDLPDAETTFLVEPQRSDISDSLWKQDWDILFFAGHSQTEGDKGRIYINQTESLTLDELRYALRNAVNRGLTLAVFNSCDGMGLAFELQQLHIPQIIVMREPVPDVVAQKFITDFLPLLASGKYLYLAQREAREKLQGLEYQFPCASWLPVMFQDPATVQPTWQDLGRRSTNVCPYRGLFAFSEEDAQFFFGRDAFISRLLSAVQNESLVAVIGPSGSGKSSVVFAGLIPELRRAGNWLVASFRPSSRPFYALASTLVNHLEPQISGDAKLQKIEDLVAQLQSANSLQNVAGDITTRNPKCKLLLVADQFEELYTLSQDLQERQIFLDRLLEAIACPSDLTVVITLRADFLAQALSYRPFADALQHRDLKLGPMNASELLAAIEQPAALLGVTLEPGLAERILGAIATQAGNLPLLEFALTQLWEKRIDTVLQNAAYNEIHGVEAAVAHYADRVCDKLNQKEKEQARLIFIQLVHLGEETGDTRRLATRVEVGEENWDLVTRLADARLVVTGYDEAMGNETVEIVHEALIQKWGHLRQWLELDRDFRTWLQELRAARQQWEKSNRDKDALLRGKALADAQQWLQKRPDELTLEQEYQGHRERVVDVSFSPDGKTIATASDDRTAKIWKLDGTLCVTLEGHEDEVNGISFSPDGRTIATASDDKTVKLWKLDDTLCQTPNRTINAYKTLIGHEERIISVKFSPNGKQIASASFDKTIKLWKQDGRLLRTFQGHDDWVWSVDFSSDGQKLASASYDTTIRFWNLGNIETEILDLDDWLKKGCSQVRDYLKNSSKVIESDKHLCDGIGS